MGAEKEVMYILQAGLAIGGDSYIWCWVGAAEGMEDGGSFSSERRMKYRAVVLDGNMNSRFSMGIKDASCKALLGFAAVGVKDAPVGKEKVLGSREKS